MELLDVKICDLQEYIAANYDAIGDNTTPNFDIVERFSVKGNINIRLFSQKMVMVDGGIIRCYYIFIQLKERLFVHKSAHYTVPYSTVDKFLAVKLFDNIHNLNLTDNNFMMWFMKERDGIRADINDPVGKYLISSSVKSARNNSSYLT